MTETILDPVEAIARATLYEGYVLWPYRRSAVKNQRRFTFGGVYPRGFCETAAEGDAWRIRCEALVEGGAATRLTVELRFLHAVHRQVLAPIVPGDDAELVEVDRLEAAGEAHLTWDEAAERRFALPETDLGTLLAVPREEQVEVLDGRDLQELAGGDGGRLGALRRTWEPVAAGVRVEAEAIEQRRDGGLLARVCVAVDNRGEWRGADRAAAQRRALLSTHLVLRARGGAFHSLADPPEEVAAAAAGCRNEGVWPVLVGDGGARDTLLASPIILEDHPRIAPESPGDLFDGGEIDQLLVLNILALSDEEKREMAASDPRTRDILARTEGLSPAELMRLHGTFRDSETPR